MIIFLRKELPLWTAGANPVEPFLQSSVSIPPCPNNWTSPPPSYFLQVWPPLRLLSAANEHSRCGCTSRFIFDSLHRSSGISRALLGGLLCIPSRNESSPLFYQVTICIVSCMPFYQISNFFRCRESDVYQAPPLPPRRYH